MKKIFKSLFLFLFVVLGYGLYDFFSFKKIESLVPQIKNNEQKLTGIIVSPEEFQSVVKNGTGFLKVKAICSNEVFEKVISSPIFPQKFEMTIKDKCQSFLFEAAYSDFDFQRFSGQLMPLVISYQYPFVFQNHNLSEPINIGQHHFTVRMPTAVGTQVTIPEFNSGGCKNVKNEAVISGFYRLSQALKKRFVAQAAVDLNLVFLGVDFDVDQKQKVPTYAGAIQIEKQSYDRKVPFEIFLNQPHSAYMAVLVPGSKLPHSLDETAAVFRHEFGVSITPTAYTKSFSLISCMPHKNIDVIFVDPLERTDSILTEIRMPSK